MERPTPQAVQDPFGEDDSATGERLCEHPQCGVPGLYRAPASPQRLNSYRWFCLQHIREYNAAWNYYSGLSDATVEQLRREDTVWRRPSWPFTQGRRGGTSSGLNDPFGFFSEKPSPSPAKGPQSEERKALEALGLEYGVSLERIKTRYKELVKRLHPDANGGDSTAEERLKVINQAYSTLKASCIS